MSNGTVLFADYVIANTTLHSPNADPTCDRASQIVSANLCRIGLNVSISA
jgi:feruloyl esterase